MSPWIYDRLRTSGLLRRIYLGFATDLKVRMNVVLGLVPFEKSDLVLDVGCAWGVSSFYFISRVNRIVGVEINQRYLKDYVTIGFGRRYQKFMPICADGSCLPLKNSSFTKVVACEVIEHIDDDRLFCDDVNRVLAPGGYLILTTPNSNVGWIDLGIARFIPKWLRHAQSKEYEKYGHKRDGYTATEIENILVSSGFRICKHEYTYLKIARILIPVIELTKLRLLLHILLSPLGYFDRFCKGEGICHVILAQKV